MTKTRFCKLLDEAIKDEEGAQKFYRKLRKSADYDGAMARNIIKRIAKQEKNHASELKDVRRWTCEK